MKYCPRCQLKYDDLQRFCQNERVRLSLPDPYRLVGNTLEGKYRIEALIGVGGFGAVYSAQHLGLDREVAFKVLKPDIALQAPASVDLFASEAKTAARLAHENIVTVYDAGQTIDGIAYIAMEWLDGCALDDELRTHNKLSFERTAEILRQVAAALDEAHAKRVIHRDLKPANVMLVQRPDGRERVKVVDFGIAKVLSATVGSLVSRVMGTPHYASPEQFQLGANIDGRADIYALGVMLYEMLTGALPFNAPSVHELVRLQMTASPPPLRNLCPNAPANVEQLVNRMLAKEPDQRPQCVSEVPGLFDLALSSPDQSLAATLIVDAQPKTREKALEEQSEMPSQTTSDLQKSSPLEIASDQSTERILERQAETARADRPDDALKRYLAFVITIGEVILVAVLAFLAYWKVHRLQGDNPMVVVIIGAPILVSVLAYWLGPPWQTNGTVLAIPQRSQANRVGGVIIGVVILVTVLAYLAFLAYWVVHRRW